MTDRTTPVPVLTGRAEHVRRTSDGLRVKPFVMDNRWVDGDPSVLLAAVS
jgi:hypothetical protein